MAEKDVNQYNNLVRRRNTARRQYNACSDRIEECNYLLRRLRRAKERVAEQKRTFKTIKKEDSKIYKEKYDWEGKKYNSFKVKGEVAVDLNEDYYKNTLDYVLDSINNEITRIENKRMNEYGLLGRLGSTINSLGNKIENFFN
ncbi:MAG: DUF5082 domain-containing protein [Ruminococcaceae bacterium]|nr:DUF5082 domain-containing protein [Oscillospiraceae bacterium]